MGKSHDKGKRFERDTAKWAVEAGEDIDDDRYAVTGSGRLGPNTSLQFDIPTINYCIECKHRSSVPKWLTGAWEQVIDVADNEGKKPLLAIKKNYKPIMHVITPERHAELLEYERRYKDERG